MQNKKEKEVIRVIENGNWGETDGSAAKTRRHMCHVSGEAASCSKTTSIQIRFCRSRTVRGLGSAGM